MQFNFVQGGGVKILLFTFFETSSKYIFLLMGGVNETNTNILVSGPTVEGFGSVSSRPRVPRSVSPGTPDIGTGGLDLALIGGDPCNVDPLLFKTL